MSAWIVSHGHIDAIVNFYCNEHHNNRLYKDTSPMKFERYINNNWTEIIGDLDECSEEIYVNRQRLGEILLNENIRSVEARYSRSSRADLPGVIVEVEAMAEHQKEYEAADNLGGYKYNPNNHRNISVGQFISCLNCLDYQSCEHDEWEDSNAKFIIDTMKHNVIRHQVLPDVEGFNDAKWGLD
jgi:hypothetical protein